MSEEVGRDIGNGLGKVVEVDLKAFSSDQARFLCVRVELPLEKLLRRIVLSQVLKEIRLVLDLNMKD